MNGELDKTDAGGRGRSRQSGDDSPTAGDGGEATLVARDVAKAAAVGAVIGAVVGALVRIADAETGAQQLEAIRKSATQAGRDVATAALTAATEVVARNRLGELVARRSGNGDRGTAMRATAKEAGLAAAVAARKVLAEKARERTRTPELE